MISQVLGRKLCGKKFLMDLRSTQIHLKYCVDFFLIHKTYYLEKHITTYLYYFNDVTNKNKYC